MPVVSWCATQINRSTFSPTIRKWCLVLSADRKTRTLPRASRSTPRGTRPTSNCNNNKEWGWYTESTLPDRNLPLERSHPHRLMACCRFKRTSDAFFSAQEKSKSCGTEIYALSLQREQWILSFGKKTIQLTPKGNKLVPLFFFNA